MGLPDFDPVYEILHDLEDISATQHAKDVFDPEAMSVWWAGKELANEKCLLDYVGRNEKTKIVVKIQKVLYIYAVRMKFLAIDLVVVVWVFFRRDRELLSVNLPSTRQANATSWLTTTENKKSKKYDSNLFQLQFPHPSIYTIVSPMFSSLLASR